MIAQLNDQQLDNVLAYLEEMVALSELDAQTSDHLSKIMSEDDHLLKRLAQ